MIQDLSTVIIMRPSGVLRNLLNARKIERKQGFWSSKVLHAFEEVPSVILA